MLKRNANNHWLFSPIYVVLTFLGLTATIQMHGQICNPNGNLAIFSNYEGGTLTINCDVNIPNLKIGIVTYESPQVNFIGPFANQITEVIYAGFGGTGSCTGNTTVEINGVDPSIVTIYTNDQPAISPYLGDPIFPGSPPLVNCMVSAEGCNNSAGGGGNSSNQIVQFFLAEFTAPVVFRSHFTQYDCWSNVEEDLSATGNCCIADPTTPINPIYVSPASYDLIPETEFSLCNGPVTVFIPYEVLFQPPTYPGYIWSNGATGQTVTFTEPGVYSVTAGDYCHFGANALLEDQIEITACVDGPLTVEVIAPGTACAGVPFQIEGIITGGFPPYTINWFPFTLVGLGPFEIIANSDYDYNLSVQDAQGNSFTIGGTVQISGSLNVSITGDFDLCDGQANLVANSPNATSLLWSTGASTSTITVTEPGTYSVTATSLCGSVSDEVEILPCELVVGVTAPGIACVGVPFEIEGSVTGGAPPYIIEWTPNFGADLGPYTFTENQDLFYSLTVTDSNGDTQTVSGIVILDSELTLGISGDIDLCDGQAILTANSPNATSFLWNTGASTATITVTEPGTYSVTATSQCGSVSENLEVGPCITELLVSIEGESEICSGSFGSIEALISGGVTPYSIVWNQGLGNTTGPFIITPTANTTYTVSVTDAEGTVAAASLSITIVTSSLSLDLGPDISFCADNPQQIGANVENAVLYIWSNGAGTPFIQPTVTGTYILQASDLCSTVSDEIEVTVISSGSTPFGRTFRLCEGDSLRIGPAESEQYNVAWNTGENTDGILVTESGAYAGLIIDQCGTNNFTVNVNFVDCSCNIFIPNAFTPNLDGVNDLFGIETRCKVRNYEFLIFDRWGKEVFATNDPDLNWNGSFQGSSYFCDAGVYTYYLQAEQDTDLFVPEPIKIWGSVTLVR